MPGGRKRKALADQQFRNRVAKIQQKQFGKYTNTRKDWTFCKSSNISKLYGKTFSTPFVALNTDGTIDIAYLPNMIPDEIRTNIMNNMNTKLTKEMALIIGSWNRYKNYIFECSMNRSDPGIEQLASCCNNFVRKLLQTYSKSMMKLLQKVDTRLQKFASFPTLCLNVLKATNFDPKKKPYKPHKDPLDIGLGVLLYFGEYSGGSLTLTDYDITLNTKAGDVLLMNSRKYRHQVNEVKSGTRIGLVYFLGSDHVPLLQVKKLKSNPRSKRYSDIIKKNKKKYICIVRQERLKYFKVNPSNEDNIKIKFLYFKNDIILKYISSLPFNNYGEEQGMNIKVIKELSYFDNHSMKTISK